MMLDKCKVRSVSKTTSNCRIVDEEVPKLSAAIATPPLNFTAITDVPVTAGD
jgi:hypothetical protein